MMKIPKVPGIVKRSRADGSVAWYWSAANCSRHAKDYPVKTVRLTQTSEADRVFYAMRLHSELLEWLGHRQNDPIASFDGTMAGLIRVYQMDPQSPFHKLKANTRENYVYDLRFLNRKVGSNSLHNLSARDFIQWYDNAKRPEKAGGSERVRRAHGLITMVRIVIRWGAVLELDECDRLSNILSRLEFKQPAARREIVTYDQAVAIIAKAHEMGRPSVAFAQALQFELTLRQSQVIGQWLRYDGPAPEGGLLDGRRHWQDGLTWNDILPHFTLSKRTSKTGAPAEFNLKLYPLVMAEIERSRPAERIGPLIKDESSGLPYRKGRFARVWREIARAAGVPDDVWNRDSRAGGITEATGVADLESVRHHAQHSNSAMTARYSRGTLEKTSKVAELRTAARKGLNQD